MDSQANEKQLSTPSKSPLKTITSYIPQGVPCLVIIIGLF